MLDDFDLTQITGPLLAWYSKNARSLPWRREVTPYRVWVSEIMLQQTRVEAVKPYFSRFMEALPTIRHLAQCEEDTLLKLWEGLGYYSRVRNLQAAARTVMDQYDGQLPADYHQLLSLKGIGHYTAGAIASIAYGIPAPAVDGNVFRVISRVTADDTDITKAAFRTALEQRLLEIIPPDSASAFTQALMDLGATVCLPKGDPLCDQCPWQSFCRARASGDVLAYPVKKKPPARRLEKRTVLLIRDGEHIVLRKRPSRGLLAGLYEFPNQDGHLTSAEALDAVRSLQLMPLHIQPLTDARHVFSHVEWQMKGYLIRVDSLTRDEADLLFVELRQAREHYPIPSAFSAYAKLLFADEGNPAEIE